MHFVDEEAEAQRCEVSCQRIKMWSQGLDQDSSCPQIQSSRPFIFAVFRTMVFSGIYMGSLVSFILANRRVSAREIPNLYEKNLFVLVLI